MHKNRNSKDAQADIVGDLPEDDSVCSETTEEKQMADNGDLGPRLKIGLTRQADEQLGKTGLFETVDKNDAGQANG